MDDGFRAAIFDLDGTLLDTLEDLADSMNMVLKKCGFPQHPVDAYRYFVGDGMDILAERVLPEGQRNAEIIGRCTMLMREEYAKRWADKTKPYDGIGELLEGLSQRGIRKGILSNKSHDFTIEVVRHFFGENSFDIVMGAGPFPKKPDPSSTLHIAQKIGVEPSRVVYCGDTNTDMKTATAAKVYAVGVCWGFRSAEELLENGANVLIEHPGQLLSVTDTARG
jgi:phosphoglycolate phosphatase